MNNRYFEIFKTKVDNFATEIARSKLLYENLEKKNNLLHPGEYGNHKEKTFKELMKFIKPFKFEITDGFIINSHNETSTQCDIILFDKLNTPLVEFGDRFQFIPAESVAALGEVKSVLSKDDFIKSAIKLSKNKAICRPSDDYVTNFPNYNQQLFPPFSFIICDSISGINEEYTFKN